MVLIEGKRIKEKGLQNSKHAKIWSKEQVLPYLKCIKSR